MAPPEIATEDERELAAIALERQVEVMLGRVPGPLAHSVLAAANRIRDQIVGPLAQKIEHEAKSGFSVITETTKNLDG